MIRRLLNALGCAVGAWPPELESSSCCRHDAYDHEDRRGPCMIVGCPCQAWKPKETP